LRLGRHERRIAAADLQPGVYESDADATEAIDVTFGNPSGSSLLFTDVGENYGFSGSQIRGGTDGFGSVLALQTSSDDNTQLDASQVYCVDSSDMYAPEVSPNGS
jgi:hypothetical protein